LHFFGLMAMLVLAHEMHLLELLQMLHPVAANVAGSYARLLGILVRNLYEFFAALLGQIRHPQADDLSFRLRVEAEIGGADGFLDRDPETAAPPLHLKESRLGNGDRGALVERHRSAIGLDMTGLEQRDRRPASPQPAEIVLERLDGAMHAALQFIRIIRSGL